MLLLTNKIDGGDFMGRTHIRMGCPNCGYTYSTSVYGYVEDPIGIPLTRCPRCSQIFKDSKHKEWIQMSPIKKYFSISPRGNIVSIFLAFIPMIIFVRSNIELGDAFWGVLIASWFVANHIVIAIRVNSQACMERIISSVSRTNDEEYAQLLSKFGKIYDHSIPNVLMLTRANKELLEYTIKNKKTENIIIPTFTNSINNY